MKLAFTLIELLTVIAIIAILAALLFPVLAKARAAALQSTALSNAREIGVAESLYQNDNDGQFVLYFSGLISADGANRVYGPPLSYWPQTLTPYLGTVRITPGSNQSLIQDLPKVFVDPVKGFKPQDPAHWPIGNVSSWGISDNIVQWFCPPGVRAAFVPVSAESVANPSECLLLAETWDYYSPSHDLAGSAIAASFFDGGVGDRNGATVYLDSPHQANYKKADAGTEPDPKGRNVAVFVDGHAKALITGSLTRSGKFWSVGNNEAWP